MSRYTGPTHKLCRREGVALCDSPKCPVHGKRKYPPGQHGVKGYPRGMSVYGQQLRAKQRAKRLYGVLERQFRRMFEIARVMKGNTAENLLGLLESRLDNVVYRLGFAETRPQARQFVTHDHIWVNGKKVNIPSYLIKKDDIISLSVRAMKHQYFKDKAESFAKKDRPSWLTFEPAKHTGKVVDSPNVVDLMEFLQPSMIVELYSK